MKVMVKTKITNYEIERMFLWCIEEFGFSAYQRKLPKLIISNSKTRDCGLYNFDRNEITIYTLNIKSLLDLCATVIHEYTHYLQSKDQFIYLKKEHTCIDFHPFEKQARKQEEKYKKKLRKYINNAFI